MAETKTERTCANCGCAAEIKHPVEVGRSQWVCRKNGLFVIDVPNRGPMLTYPPTTTEGTCFNDWRPLGTRPGDRWRMEAMLRKIRPIFTEALKQSGAPPATLDLLAQAMADSDEDAAAFDIPPDAQKN